MWKQLEDPINAEIAGGWIGNAQDAVDLLTWSFFFRRLLYNPAYYHLHQVSAKDISEYTSRLIEYVLQRLEKENCITLEKDANQRAQHPPRWLEPEMQRQEPAIVNALQSTSTTCSGWDVHPSPPITIVPTFFGKIAAFYYLSYKTVGWLSKVWTKNATWMTVLGWLTSSEEFADIPVRHDEEIVNASLLQQIQQQIAPLDKRVTNVSGYQETRTVLQSQVRDMEDPRCKAWLLFCAHCSRCLFSVIDYYTDLYTALEQAGRVLQAMIDIAIQQDDIATATRCIHWSQCFAQGCWPWEGSFATLITTRLPECENWLVQQWDIKETGEDFFVGWKKNKTAWLQPLEHNQRQILERLYTTTPMLQMQVQWNSDNQSIHVHLKRWSPWNKQQRDLWMYQSRRANDETWFLILVDSTNGKIGAFRRIRSFKRNNDMTLYPQDNWKKENSILLLLSANYRGLDQIFRCWDNSVQFISNNTSCFSWQQ